jgi:hypothetical protein
MRAKVGTLPKIGTILKTYFGRRCAEVPKGNPLRDQATRLSAP